MSQCHFVCGAGENGTLQAASDWYLGTLYISKRFARAPVAAARANTFSRSGINNGPELKILGFLLGDLALGFYRIPNRGTSISISYNRLTEIPISTKSP